MDLSPRTLYLSSCFLGALGAVFVFYYGQQLGLIDNPVKRSSHTTPTPKGGGIGILAAFLVSSIALDLPPLFTISTCLIAFTGLLGDRFHIRVKLRLAVHFGCALLALFALSSFQSPGSLHYALLPLWPVFIVGSANFYNFMDGINGIASITSIVAFSLMAWFSDKAGIDPSFSMLALAIACSSLGFLPFNLPNARVFMGDVGSILLGFVFSLLVFVFSANSLDFLCYASLLFPFYIDELTTMAIRVKNGENLSQAHRKHLYQILSNELNLKHWNVSFLYGGVQIVVGLSVFNLKPYGLLAVLLFLLLAALSFSLINFLVRSKVTLPD